MRYLSFLMFSMIICTTIACKTSKEQSCEKCNLKPPAGTVPVAMQGRTLNFHYWPESNKPYTFASTEREESEFLSKFVSTSLAEPVTGVTAALVLYVENDIKSIKLTKSSVAGFSRYFVVDNRLRHQFFFKYGEVFKSVESLDQEIPVFYTDNVHALADIYYHGKTITSLFIPTDELVRTHTSVSDQLSPVINALQAKANKHSQVPLQRGPYCGSPCNAWVNHGCTYTITGFQCGHTFDHCYEGDAAYKTAQDGILPQNMVDALYDTSLHYNFRDSFLAQSAVGGKYIAYYYTLKPSYYLSSTILTKNATVLPGVNSAIVKLMNPSAYSTDTLIGAVLRAQLLDLADDYIAAAPDTLQLSVFTDFKVDIDHFSLRSVSSVVAEL